MITSHSGGEQIRNPTIEIQNKHEHKIQSIRKVRRIPFKQFCHLDLFSGFDIRASDFPSHMAELLADALA